MMHRYLWNRVCHPIYCCAKSLRMHCQTSFSHTFDQECFTKWKNTQIFAGLRYCNSVQLGYFFHLVKHSWSKEWENLVWQCILWVLAHWHTLLWNFWFHLMTSHNFTYVAKGPLMSLPCLEKSKAWIPVCRSPSNPRKWITFNSFGGSKETAKWNRP